MTQIAVPDLHTEPVDVLELDPIDPIDPPTGPSRASSLGRRFSGPYQSLKAIPHVGTWIGVLLATAGAILLVVCWVRTAALTNVALQVPYVVSAGFTGIALVVVGLTVVNIAVKREDAAERATQLGDLRELLAQIRETVES